MNLTSHEIQQGFKELARDDYSFYLEWTHGHDYHIARHHQLICDGLEAIDRGELNKLMIFMPPRHGKSATVSETFPSWYLGRNPNRKVILASYGDALAKKFGRANRHKVEQFGRELFDIQIAKDNGSVNNWGLQGYEGFMLSTSFNSTVTGYGCSCLIIDDPLKSRQQAESEVHRENIWSEYQSTLLTRLERKRGSAQILIQTRWHTDDLAGRLLNNETDWHVISLPAEAEDHTDQLGREIGEPLWAEQGFDHKWLEETKKAVGERTWASLYQQRPTALEGGLFKRKHFQYYRQAPASFDEVIMSVDTTFKDASNSDFAVFQIWGKKGASKYLLDQVRDRMDVIQAMNTIRNLTAKFPQAHRKLIEDKANGSAIISMLRQEISGLVPVNPTDSKVARAYSVTPDIEAGNVFLPLEAPWLADFLGEVTAFPNVKNDDQTDSMTQALSHLQQANDIFIGRA